MNMGNAEGYLLMGKNSNRPCKGRKIKVEERFTSKWIKGYI
jgi:hypothetical protein